MVQVYLVSMLLAFTNYQFISGVDGSATFTFLNMCAYTVWPGISSSAGSAPLSTTGFSLQEGESKSIQAPSSWGGRFWARTKCSQNSTGKFTCLTGDCGSGKVECEGGSVALPVTLAEIKLDFDGGTDIYDVSLVDGYNLPLMVVPQGGSGGPCTTTGCVVDLNGECPAKLKVTNSDGDGVVCKSPCAAFNEDQYCCTGAYSNPDTCKPSSYSVAFKKACPRVYTYAYDDDNSFTCIGADYLIMFCPSPATWIQGGHCGSDNSSCSKGYPPPTAVTIPPAPGARAPGHMVKERRKNLPLKMIIGVTVPGIGIFTFLLIICYYKCIKNRNDNNQLEALVKKFESSTPRRYSYADIKKMTKSFKDELGKGGFGNVYKGYLSDGIPVAVKLLNTTKGDGEDFVNEVASISRTSHVNVVSLLGFCLDGRKRALVYEFMSNGSLEKHIKKECNLQMGMEELFKIAIGVARGLEYLHGGMNTRILHFDIKPHNILLDEDFCPKISDFGLAKLSNRKQSFVSMLEARGTIGYIAPEVFSRNFGVVSYKSDVYSYGMMVLEMVGARSNLTTAEMTNSSNAYFPDWVYQRITCNEDQNLQADAMTREGELERKMMVVGLWCIQTNPSHRPSMDKVIDMLEGSLEGLVVPPRPLLYSRSISERASLERSILESETTLASSLVSAVGSTHGPKLLPF